MLLKQSTARNVPILMVQSADHVTGLTGATLTITSSKDGAAFASISPTVTERGTGWYSLALTTAHTDTLGALALHITAASGDPSDVLHEVVAFDPQDATRLGLSALPNAAAGANTGLPVVGSQIPNANAGATGGLWLMSSVIEGTKTVQQYLQWMAAALFGKLSGVSTNTPTFLSPSDGTTTRITAVTTTDGRSSTILS